MIYLTHFVNSGTAMNKYYGPFNHSVVIYQNKHQIFLLPLPVAIFLTWDCLKGSPKPRSAKNLLLTAY